MLRRSALLGSAWLLLFTCLLLSGAWHVGEDGDHHLGSRCATCIAPPAVLDLAPPATAVAAMQLARHETPAAERKAPSAPTGAATPVRGPPQGRNV